MNIISVLRNINLSGKTSIRADVLKRYSRYYVHYYDTYGSEKSAAMAASLTLTYYNYKREAYKALRSIGVDC